MDHWSNSTPNRSEERRADLASYFQMKGGHFQDEFQSEDRSEDNIQIVQGFGIVLMLIVILNPPSRFARHPKILLSSPGRRCWSWSTRRSRIRTEARWRTTRSSVDFSSPGCNVWSVWLSGRIRCISAGERREWEEWREMGELTWFLSNSQLRYSCSPSFWKVTITKPTKIFTMKKAMT